MRIFASWKREALFQHVFFGVNPLQLQVIQERRRRPGSSRSKSNALKGSAPWALLRFPATTWCICTGTYQKRSPSGWGSAWCATKRSPVRGRQAQVVCERLAWFMRVPRNTGVLDRIHTIECTFVLRMREDSAQHTLNMLKCRFAQVVFFGDSPQHLAGSDGPELTQSNLPDAVRDVIAPDFLVPLSLCMRNSSL